MRRPRSDIVFLLASFAVLAWLFVWGSYAASHVVGNTRYFWLDDDMMISMRYGRNLAEGHGLAWNQGDHVEGYTNFLWTIVMALVHLVGFSDAHAALGVRGVNFALLCALLVVSVRLLRLFAPRPMLAAPLLLATMITCPDVVLWAVWGFETTLLAFLSTLFYYRLLSRGLDRVAFVALALIPLTRGDGLYLFATHAIVTLFVVESSVRRRAIRDLVLAAIPAIGHLAFRKWYYGDWLPNTYYLKVYLVDNVAARGYGYARSFVIDHALVLALAIGSALSVLRSDRRALVLFVTLSASLLYVVTTGGDMMGWFRFFAHVMPLLFVFATIGIARVVTRPVARLVWAAVLLIGTVPLVDPWRRLLSRDTNGDPDKQLRVALVVKEHALPNSTVAVFCAGIIPYFTRLPAIDLLGKSDRHIAHLPAYPGAMIGHGKVDPEYSLSQNPDLVVTCNTPYANALNTAPDARSIDPMVAILGAPSFRNRYMPSPVMQSFFLKETAVYTYPESREYPRRGWDLPLP